MLFTFFKKNIKLLIQNESIWRPLAPELGIEVSCVKTLYFHLKILYPPTFC